MFLRHLTLAHYRSYGRLDLRLSEGLSVFWGDNGQGKSNLLEAAYLLATSRSYRTSAERDLVSWYADTSPVFARVAGEVVRHGAVHKLEVILAESQAGGAARITPDATAEETSAVAPGRAPAVSVRRRVRINNHERPVLELLGHFNTVLFSPEDVELVAGPAEIRRRYLDITLCQIDHRYLRALRRYVRVLTQRNALLRRSKEAPVPPDQFEFWDSQLAELGSHLILTRLKAVAYLNERLQEVYPRLTSDPGMLRLTYRSSVPLEDGFSVGSDGHLDEEAAGAIQRRFIDHLQAIRVRERQQGVTLAGTHRDDATFSVEGVDLRTYGSRGQQRTAALALKLAETSLMERTTGERPVLLLDDVMSELDPTRRAFLQEAVTGHDQVLITATDLGFFSPAFLENVRRFQVRGGTIHEEG
jgi:DNA replication and repair protein RecF